MIRTPQALIPYLFALAAFSAGLLWQLGDDAEPGRTRTYGTATVGGPFSLTDQFGKTRTNRDFRGKFMLIYFGYTHCPDVCPLTLGVIAGALQELGPSAGRIVPIFVTVDPARDTVKVMKEYLGSFGPRFVGLTGTPQQIAAVAREYRVYFAKQTPAHGDYEVSHSSVIYLMDADGRFVADYDETLGPDGLARALRARL